MTQSSRHVTAAILEVLREDTKDGVGLPVDVPQGLRHEIAFGTLEEFFQRGDGCLRWRADQTKCLNHEDQDLWVRVAKALD